MNEVNESPDNLKYCLFSEVEQWQRNTAYWHLRALMVSYCTLGRIQTTATNN